MECKINVRFVIVACVCLSVSFAENFPRYSVGHKLQRELDFNSSKLRLFIVGNYMAAHKYFGADYRYLAGDISDDDLVFHKQFPSRPLRELHTELARECRRSVEYCLQTVYDVARVSGTMSRFFKNKIKNKPLFEPFPNAYEMFKFRQTAAYFLCYYTVNWKMEKSNMKYFQHSGKPNCIDKLVYVNDVSEKKRKAVLLHRPAHIIKDWRARKHFNYRHYGMMCALIWFCPDPCFGRKTHGETSQVYKYDLGNPCKDLPDKTCDWDWKANGNFKDLIRNKFNITCECVSERKGFVWNSQYETCVDVDECHDHRVRNNCDRNKVCRNTVGSYKCTCPRGFQENSTSGACEKMALISGNIAGYSAQGPAHTLQVKTSDEEDIVSDMMAFVGFSAATSLSIDFVFIFTFLITLTIFLF